MSRGISGSGRLDQGLAESSRQACSYKPEAQASGSALIQARSASEWFGLAYGAQWDIVMAVCHSLARPACTVGHSLARRACTVGHSLALRACSERSPR